LVKQVLHIRRAVADDAKLIAELSAITFFDTFKGTCTDDDMQGFIKDYFSIEQVEKELQDNDDFYFIAFINGNPAGYIRMKEEVSDVEIINKHRGIELKRIYVLKEYHSKKIGAALMNFALDFATEKNYELIWLGVWEHNERARAFYNKFGFEDSGVMHPFPIGNTPQTDVWLYRFIEQR
jgi:ribosomal protein S18 acetylase RimI-like enzyme